MAARQPRKSVASFLNTDDEVSIELSKVVVEPAMVEAYINEFSTVVIPDSKTTTHVAKMFFAAKPVEMVKMKVIGSDESSMFTEQKRTFKIDDSATIIARKLNPVKNVPQVANRAELIIQTTMALIGNPDWLLRINIVKRIDNPIEFAARLKQAKTALMDTPFDKMEMDAYEYIIPELIRVKQEPVEFGEILNLVHTIVSKSNIDGVDEKYQETIFNLAKDIYRDATTISKFKRESGFKRLCPSPVELSRIVFFKKMLPEIDSYYMTDKMDGLHAVLVIDEIFKINGKRKSYIGANIYAVSDTIYTISTCEHKPSRNVVVEHTVLDVEMMEGKDGKSFHCFDVIAIKSKRTCGIPFYKRFEYFGAANSLLEKHELGSVKEFIRLSKESYCKQLTEFYGKTRKYNIDGIIFTPAGMFFKEALKLRTNRFERIFNTEYANTISFKWKPLDQLTIDFYIMEYPKKKGAYALCSGVDSKTFKRLNMSFFDGYKAPGSPNSFQYFPIQFETYDAEFDYVWEPPKSESSKNLNGMVGEFKLANKDGLLPKPQLLRLRTDREGDIARGEYYGNALRYSELIWHSIKYPLKIETMCNPVNTAYFAAEDSEGWYKAGRSFNSFVKTHLMETYLPIKGKSRLMDVAAGKGQDLARAVDLGYSEIVAMDKDTDALTELLERKYNLRVKTKNASASVFIKRIDLEDSAEDNIKSLKIEKESVDNLMINFALHYICHSATTAKMDPITEFVKLCGHYLKKNGRVLITTFNGEDVYEKLKDVDEWSITENNRLKYAIRKDYASDELTNLDQSIDVLLPFSAGEYYHEYLVNYKYIESVFEQHGFSTVNADSFESLIRVFKKQNSNGYRAMTDGDKEYVSLYGFMVFEKN